MLAYIITFSVSLLGTYFANKYYRQKVSFVFFSFIALLPPILLAGFRNHTVGVDTDFYILNVFDDAINSENFETLRNKLGGDFEVLYLLINYLTSRLSNNSVIMLVVIHSFIMIPLYVTAIKWRNKLSPVFFLFIFYCIYYQESLSFVRQAIALSFSLLAFTYYIEKKRIFYITYSIIAIGFHNTAVIPLIFPVIYWLVGKYPLKKFYLFHVVIGLVFATLMWNFDNIIMWLVRANVINVRYIAYTSLGTSFSGKLGLTNFIIKIITVGYFFFIMSKTKVKRTTDFFLIIAILDLVLSLCGLIVDHLIRLSLYARLISCISISYILKHNVVLVNGVKLPMKGMFCLLLLFFWYYVYIHGDFAATANYELNKNFFNL